MSVYKPFLTIEYIIYAFGKLLAKIEFSFVPDNGSIGNAE